MKEIEKMINGRLYNPADPELDAYHLQRMALCQQLNQTPLLDQAGDAIKRSADFFG